MSSGTTLMHFPTPSTAEEWVARLRASDVTAEEHDAFESWLKAEASHRSEYAKCRELEAMPALVQNHPELMGDLSKRSRSRNRTLSVSPTRNRPLIGSDRNDSLLITSGLSV